MENVMLFMYRTLDHNNLTSLQKDAFEGLAKLKHITLGDNPLICDCHLAWLYQWLRKAPKSASQARCNSPYHLRDKAIDEVLESEFKCAGKSSHAFKLPIRRTFVSSFVLKIFSFERQNDFEMIINPLIQPSSSFTIAFPSLLFKPIIFCILF
jgi:hypothetical protein